MATANRPYGWADPNGPRWTLGTCECCRQVPAARVVEYSTFRPDGVLTGFTKWFEVCQQCFDRCSTDDSGEHMIHMLPGWDGSEATFERFEAPLL